MEKTEVSSANSLTVDERLWFKSFMYIRKKSGPKIDPWGMSASTGDQEDVWPFKRMHWCLPHKKTLNKFQRCTWDSYKLDFIK